MPVGHALGALGHEQNLHRGEHDLQVLHNPHGGDILQVHLELIIGGGIVLAIDLGQAGEAGFGLEAEGKLGHLQLVILGDLRALGPGAHDGHIPHQDAEELGGLVNADGADDLANGGDAVVMLLGQAGHAVLLGVHPHGAEFIDIELLAVLGQAQLLIEDGAAVIELDGNGRNEHEGAEDHQGRKAQEDIRQPFQGQIPDGGAAAVADQHGQVIQLHGPGALDQEVADVGPDIGLYIAVDAVFQQVVALAGGHAAEHHRPGIPAEDLAAELLGPHVRRDAVQHIEGAGQAAEDILALLPGLGVAIDQQGGSGGQESGRGPLHAEGQQPGHRHAANHQHQHGQHIGHGPDQQGRDHIHDAAADDRRHRIGIHHLRRRLEHHIKAAVEMGEHIKQQGKQQHNDDIALDKEGINVHPRPVIHKPGQRKQGAVDRRQQQAKQRLHCPTLLLGIEHRRKPHSLSVFSATLHISGVFYILMR